MSQAVANADAKAAHDAEGVSVSYWPLGEEANAIATMAFFDDAAEQREERGGERTRGHKVVMSVPKSDVTAVSVHRDRVVVPGSVMEVDAETVTARVLGMSGGREGGGSWLVRLGL